MRKLSVAFTAAAAILLTCSRPAQIAFRRIPRSNISDRDKVSFCFGSVIGKIYCPLCNIFLLMTPAPRDTFGHGGIDHADERAAYISFGRGKFGVPRFSANFYLFSFSFILCSARY
jgi:hypothetical protein